MFSAVSSPAPSRPRWCAWCTGKAPEQIASSPAIVGPVVDVLSPTWIQDLIQAYGLWVLFALVMLESMGIPMPGETALVTAALYAGSTHQIGIAPVVLVAATAAMIGDNIGYLIGEQIKRVAGPVSLLLLVAAIGLAAAGIFFFRHHEKELEQRAEAAFPGPWL